MLPHRNFTPGSYLSNHQQLRRTTVCVVVVSNLWLFGDIVFRSLFRSLSPAAKIPFQTRNGQADRKSARGQPAILGLSAGARSCVLESVGRRYGYFLFFFFR